MLVNLCQSKFCTCVVSNQPNHDLYPCSNLISDDLSTTTGFMTESFVKAPVTLLFQFAGHFAIRIIEVGVTVGSHRTSALELYVGEGGIHGTMKKVGFARILDETLTVLRFSIKKLDKLSDHQTLEKVFAVSAARLNCVNCVGLKITQAKHVPCLKFVKVFAEIPQDCISNETPALATVVTSAGEPAFEQTISQLSPSTATSSVAAEFLDPLTQEIMSLPILLPSGHNIDRSSLEKFIDAEATMLRPPSDPFTGLRFTSERRPIPNAPLKLRIDAFLLANPSVARELKAGRTLCGARYAALPHEAVPEKRTTRKRQHTVTPETSAKEPRRNTDLDVSVDRIMHTKRSFL